jgi:hypothetical protein
MIVSLLEFPQRLRPINQFFIESALIGFGHGRSFQCLFPDQSKTFLQQESPFQATAKGVPESGPELFICS